MDEMVMQARVVRTYRSAFEHEIGESIWINRALKDGIELLNSKNEYNRCSIPHLGLALDKDKQIEEYKNKQEELEIKRQINVLREKLHLLKLKFHSDSTKNTLV